MIIMYGPKHVASYTIKYDVFDVNCFIILIITKHVININKNT
jgi:hypothetical protein